MTNPKTNGQKVALVGWRESVLLPELGPQSIPAKIDTGARTTALHADEISTYEANGATWVEFMPSHRRMSDQEPCTLPVHQIRSIKNTSGIPEQRIVTISNLQIGDRVARIEISLSDRSDMNFPMIIGRSALRLLRLNVNPARSWLLSQKPTF